MIAVFVIGVGIGGESVIGGTIFNEYLPPKKSNLMVFLGASWPTGGIIGALIVISVY